MVTSRYSTIKEIKHTIRTNKVHVHLQFILNCMVSCCSTIKVIMGSTYTSQILCMIQDNSLIITIAVDGRFENLFKSRVSTT